MNIYNRRARIKELETELRILDNMFYCKANKGQKIHAHDNKKLIRYLEIERELVKISPKWRIKKFLRR